MFRTTSPKTVSIGRPLCTSQPLHLVAASVCGVSLPCSKSGGRGCPHRWHRPPQLFLESRQSFWVSAVCTAHAVSDFPDGKLSSTLFQMSSAKKYSADGSPRHRSSVCSGPAD